MSRQRQKNSAAAEQAACLLTARQIIFDLYFYLMEPSNSQSFIEAAIQELLSPKPLFYHQQDLNKMLAPHIHLTYQCLQISSTSPNHKFKAYHISQKLVSNPVQPCIIYLHGLSSYALEGAYLIPHIGSSYSLCLYDLRGHGRNTCPQISYGIKESEDLQQIIQKISIHSGVKEFYLWGRSMGAASCLYLLDKISKKGPPSIISKIKGVVLDSPFSSFFKIGQEVISLTAHIPMFITSFIAKSAFDKIRTTKRIDFMELEFTQLTHVKFPATFVYSGDDEIVGKHHSEAIMLNYGGPISKVVGNFTHNEPRSTHIIKKVMASFKGKQILSSRNINSLSAGKKAPGLSVSINIINSARNSQCVDPNQKRDLDRLQNQHIRLPMNNQNQPLKESVSYAIKQSIVSRKAPKIKTIKKIMEQNELPPTKELIPKPRSSIPRMTYNPVGSIAFKREEHKKPGSVPSVEYRNTHLLAPSAPLTNNRYL